MTYLCTGIFSLPSGRQLSPAPAAASQNLVLGRELMSLNSLLFDFCHSSGIFFPQRSRTRGKVSVHIGRSYFKASLSFSKVNSRFFLLFCHWVGVVGELCCASCLVAVTVLGLFISMWAMTDKIGTNSSRKSWNLGWEPAALQLDKPPSASQRLNCKNSHRAFRAEKTFAACKVHLQNVLIQTGWAVNSKLFKIWM